MERIFASGTFGSFAPIFARCYNAPAHCIPHVLRWMDRADIAGLNAPRPIALHYGERDPPSKDNYSASYNETVPQALRQLQEDLRRGRGEGQGAADRQQGEGARDGRRGAGGVHEIAPYCDRGRAFGAAVLAAQGLVTFSIGDRCDFRDLA